MRGLLFCFCALLGCLAMSIGSDAFAHGGGFARSRGASISFQINRGFAAQQGFYQQQAILRQRQRVFIPQAAPVYYQRAVQFQAPVYQAPVVVPFAAPSCNAFYGY